MNEHERDNHPSALVEKRVGALVSALGMKRYEVIDIAIRPLEERVRTFCATALRDHVLNGVTLEPPVPGAYPYQQRQIWRVPVEAPAPPPKRRLRKYKTLPFSDPATVPAEAIPEKDIAVMLGLSDSDAVSRGGREGKHRRWAVRRGPGKLHGVRICVAIPEEVEKWVIEEGLLR